MLEISHLTKSFGQRILWADLTLTVRPGELLALVGHSGSGKSTLLNCIGALDRPTSGCVRWKGEDLTSAGTRRRRILRKTEIGYLFQNYALVESATVAQNINYAVVGPWPWLRRNYARELQMVGMAGRHHEPIYQLSGGEQQRVALARIIAKRPALILADEPTGALDEENGQAVVDVLRNLAVEGATVVIATHNPMVRNSCDEEIQLGENATPLPVHESADNRLAPVAENTNGRPK